MEELPVRQGARRGVAGLLGVLLLSAAVPGARAQREPEEECPAPCESFQQEILVTSVHPALPGSLELTAEELQSRPTHDLVETMRAQPGLDAARRGPVNLDPNVRGLVETEVGTFVDGTRIFAAGPGRMDSELSHISPQMVGRMQVIKGPYALTWGSGTLGAINLETYRPGLSSGPLDVSGLGGARYGENASALDAYGGVWGSSERFRFHLMLESRQGSDYEDGDGVLVPGDYESSDGRLSLGFQLTDSTMLDASIGYQEQKDIDYPGRLLDATYFYTRAYGVELSRADAGPVSELFFQAYNNRKDHRMNNDEKPTAQPNPGRMPPFPIRVDLPTESNTLGGRGYAVWGDERWRWQAGADAYALEQTATRSIGNRALGNVIFTDIVWPDAEIDNVGAYLQGIFGRDDFEVGATLRIDSVDTSTGPVSDFFLDNTTGDLDQSETNYSAAFSARWALADSWTVNAGVGQAVRTATVLERYSDRFPSTKFQIAAEFMGDPGIEPETGRQLDLGFGKATSKLLFHVDLFYRVIDDYITVEIDPSLPKRLPLSPDTVYRYRNGDEAEMHGGELHLRHQPTDYLQWRLGLSYLDGEDTFFDEPLFGTPPPSASLGLTLGPRGGPYWVDFSARLVDDQNDVASARLEQPTDGYETLDILAGYRFGSGVVARVGVQNVTDETYTNHLNSLNPFTRERIGEMGRSLFAAIEYRP